MPKARNLRDGGPRRSPFFAAISSQSLDLEVAGGHQLLHPRVLLLERLQAANLVGVEGAEPILPDVDHLCRVLVPLRDGLDRLPIALPDNRTCCSSVNLDLRMCLSDSEGRISNNPWTEQRGAGHLLDESDGQLAPPSNPLPERHDVLHTLTERDQARRTTRPDCQVITVSVHYPLEGL